MRGRRVSAIVGVMVVWQKVRGVDPGAAISIAAFLFFLAIMAAGWPFSPE